MSDRPAYERGTGFLLSRLGSLAARSWAAFLAEHEVSPGQYAVLVVLNEQGPLGQVSLARSIAVDARNLVAVLDSLSERGLVGRAADPADGRRRVVSLTPAGKSLVDDLATAAARGQDDFLRALGTRDRDRFTDLLRRVYDSHTG
ncbi:MarR family winged helix-turn-helix transcriptional regulator [Amycolatopsis minnesotensis]|uniref:MarR family transcriptional regulator n=1 Tax=Amycolatopsis minnesotensis TaxID=337894 RepID=A0ABP5CNC0_9PSEU